MKRLANPIVWVVGLSLTILLSFQNCAQLTYEWPDGNDGILGNEGNPRKLLLTPTFKSKDPVAPFKVLLVIDNSKSMQLNNLKLRDSIHTLITPIKHIPVQLKIISTDALTQDKVAMENQGWTVKVSNLGPTVGASDYIKTKFNMKTTEVFSSGYDVYYHLNQVDLYNFTSNDPDFDSKVDTLKNRILQISNSGKGSDREQGLCNTLLALDDKGPNRIFQPGDKAAIVVLTDEDDSSRWHTQDTTQWRRDCRNRYTYGAIGDTSQPQVENVTYNMSTWNINFQISYERLNDGVAEPKTHNGNGGIPVSFTKFPQLVDASATTSFNCGPDELASAKNYAQYLVGSALTQNIQVHNCRIIASWTALYGFGTASEDRCNSSFGSTKLYSNMADYYAQEKKAVLVKGSCKKSVSVRMKERSFSDFYIDSATDPAILNTAYLPAAQHIPTIQKAILNRAKDLFGADGFFISSIINTNNQCIQAGSTQSIGKSYMNLSNQSPDVASRIFSSSICEADYKQSLSLLSQLISQEFDSEIVLNQILAGEEVASVVIVRGQTVIPLTLNVDYKLVAIGNSINLNIIFETNKVEVGDLIEVTLVKK